jgi:hypothetical protein
MIPDLIRVRINRFRDALRAQLKVANDSHLHDAAAIEYLRRELQSLKWHADNTRRAVSRMEAHLRDHLPQKVLSGLGLPRQ